METRKLSRATKRRLLGGFVILPPALAVLGFFVSGLAIDSRLPNPGGAAVGIGLVIGVVAFIMTVGGVLPVVLRMAERGPIERSRLVLAGALLGNVPLAVIIVGVTLVNLAAGTLERVA